jgi:hypothetical protein
MFNKSAWTITTPLGWASLAVVAGLGLTGLIGSITLYYRQQKGVKKDA